MWPLRVGNCEEIELQTQNSTHSIRIFGPDDGHMNGSTGSGQNKV